MGHLAWQVLVWGDPISSFKASQWWPPGNMWRDICGEFKGSFMLLRDFPTGIFFCLSRSPWLLVIWALHPTRDQPFFFADSLSALPPHSQGLSGTLFSSWRPPLSPLLRWDPRTFLPCFPALLTTPKPFTVWITTNCGKFLKRWKYHTTLSASWETCMQVKKQQL